MLLLDVGTESGPGRADDPIISYHNATSNPFVPFRRGASRPGWRPEAGDLLGDVTDGEVGLVGRGEPTESEPEARAGEALVDPDRRQDMTHPPARRRARRPGT